MCQSAQSLTLGELLAGWRGRDRKAFAAAPDVYLCLAERSLKLAEPLLACDVIVEGRAIKDSPALRSLHIEALSRSGAYQPALELAQTALRDSRSFATLATMGRVYKNIAYASSTREHMRPHLVLSLKYFREAYDLAARASTKIDAKVLVERSEINFAAINIATLSLLLGDHRTAYTYVNEIIRFAEPEPEAGGKSVLGEAYIILKDLKKAEHHYQVAASKAQKDLQAIAAMRRQAQFLLRNQGYPEDALNHVFSVPSVACIMGHMIDHPQATLSRFPSALLGKVKRKIDSLIIKNNVEIGYCSGGSGGDLLFAEELLRRKAEVHVVLPFSAARCRQNLVEISGDGVWCQTFDQVLAQATSVTTLADEMGTDDQTPYLYCDEVVEGLACLRARSLGTKQVNFVVWDGLEAADLRGTATTVQKWQSRQISYQLVDTGKLMGEAKIHRGGDLSPGEIIAVQDRQQISAILFADTVGFSRITDRDIPLYVQHFIGTTAHVIKALGLDSAYKNSWGDALFMVFDTIEAAAELCLTLCEKLDEVNWRQKGLPDKLSFRMALHAGPVYKLHDAITGQYNYYGYHVSQGARLEPITPPGEVYTSESFAALMAARGVKGYTCDYVGRVPLAKGFGTLPIYHLKRQAL